MGYDVETAWDKIGKFRGIINPQLNSVVLRKSLATINELAKAPSAELLQAGRHRTIRLTLESSDGPIIAVAKFFGKQSLLKDAWDKIHGSKAKRTYDTAAYLAQAGVGTTLPIACLERWVGPILKESCFVSLYLEDIACFKDMLVDLWQQNAPYGDFEKLMRLAATGIRKLHDSGCSHGDLGNQNVFFTRRANNLPYEDAVFMDLNRARFDKPLTVEQRAKDLARVALPEGFLPHFFELYWNDTPSKEFMRKWKAYKDYFSLHTATRKFRHPLRELSYRLDPRKAPAQAAYPSNEKQWVWDETTKRPADVLLPKTAIKLLEPNYRAKTRRETKLLSKKLAAYIIAPQKSNQSHDPITHRLIVDGLDPESDLVKLNFAGIRKALIRFSMADSNATTQTKIKSAQALINDGISVAITIAQMPPWKNGDLRSFANQIADSLSGAIDWVSTGQGINTIRWGIRSESDLTDLIKAEQSLLFDRPAKSLLVSASAVESPVLQFGASNIIKLFERNIPYYAITLVWDKNAGPLTKEANILHTLASSTFYANRKIIAITQDNWQTNTPEENELKSLIMEICAPSFTQPDNTQVDK